MARKKAARAPKRASKVVTRTHIATFVGLGLLCASAAAAAFGIASFSMSAMRPAITIRPGAATPAAAIVLDSQTDVEIARFDITTGSEAMLIDKFTFQNCMARNDSDGDCADAGEVSANLAQASVVKVSYQDSTGSTVTSTAAPVANIVAFNGQSFYVPARSTRTITVYANTTTIDDVGVFSGDRFQVNLTATGASFPFRAVGKTSGRTFDETFINRSVMSSTMVLRNTEPTLSLSSTSPSGAAVPGLIDTLRFNAVANAAEDVELNRVTFRVTATDNAGSGWINCDELGDVSRYTLTNLTLDPATPIAAAFRAYDTSGVACGGGSNPVEYIEALVTEALPAGTPYTYSLNIDTTGASAVDDDALLVSIPSVDDMEGGIQVLTWQDYTARGTAIGGRYVDALPVNGNTLTF